MLSRTGRLVPDRHIVAAINEPLPPPVTTADLVRTALVTFVAAIVIAFLFAWWITKRNEVWAPLGPFPMQTVSHTETDGVDSDPVFDIAEGSVHVTAQKCREGPVQVYGEAAWRRVSPGGYASPPTQFPPTVQPDGCVTQQFENPIPEAVIADVCANGTSIWHIAGIERPVGDVTGDGTVVPRSGAELGWETEPFTLTCQGGI